MKKIRKTLSAVALAAGALLAAAPASAAITVSFVPSASHINVGDSVSVQMNISGLGSEILSAFDINMIYGAVLNNVGVTHNVGTQWPGGGVFGPSVFGAGNTGVIDYAYDDDATLAAAQADAFTALTFGFTGEADGFTLINLGADPDFDRNFVGLDFQSLTVDVQGTCVSVGRDTTCGGGGNTVPEPASLALLGIGLACMGFTRRRKG